MSLLMHIITLSYLSLKNKIHRTTKCLEFFGKLFIPIFFIFNSYCLANNKKFIPYDWGSQFGYVSENGMIMWGQDWEANNLLFDGSWAIFPPMFGEEIENSFQGSPGTKVNADSLKLRQKLIIIKETMVLINSP